MTDKLDMTSPDLVSQNIEKIAQLFPNCVTESENGLAIDFDQLKQELSNDIVEGNKERYRLEWPGKREAIVTANLPINKTLRPAREESVDFDNTQNLYIEGDNLEVLKLLQESYLGKVKMIYIDPPYNTGKDFVYKDNFTQNSDEYQEEAGLKDEYNNRLVANPDTSGRYHSDWLTMMYPRLKLARNLLTDDGVIFMSIDDNEVHNLRKVCDEVFGEIGFMGLISRSTGTPTGGGNDAIVNKVDFILVYSKSGKNNIQGLPMTDAETKIYDKQDEKGKYLIRSLRRTGGEDKRADRPSMYFPIFSPVGSPVYPIGPTGYESRWICGKDKVIEMEKIGLLEWKNIDGIWSVYQKFYLEGRMKQPSNLWDDVEGNKKATRELKSLFNDKKVFDYPKPVGLIEQIIQLIPYEDNDIILDFFSGSGTTAHAVINRNSKEIGRRKFIAVQIPELLDTNSEAYKCGYKYLSDLGKERIRRAGALIVKNQTVKIDEKKIALEKLQNDGSLLQNEEKIGELQQEINDLQTIIDNLDTGFRVYKLDSSNMQDVYYKPIDYKQENLDLFADNIKPDRTPDDLVAQIMLDWGLPLSLKIEQTKIANKKVFKVADDALLCCFDEGIDEAFAKEIAALKPLRIVFRDKSFKDDTAKENVKQLLKQLSGDSEMRVI